MRTLPVRGLLEGAADEVRFCPGSTETERGGGPPVFSGVGPWLGEAIAWAFETDGLWGGKIKGTVVEEE